ncbi:MAG: IS630 family transposase, partial [Acidimicrobiales bacterium]
MHPPSLALVDTTRHLLEGTARRPTTSQRAALRARIILLADAGQPVRAIARRLGCQPATVRKWRRRFVAQGVTGLRDADRPGRPRRISAEERCCVIATACAAPERFGLEGVTEWSARLLAGCLMTSGQVAAISGRTVQRILARAALKPHRCEYWKRATDPAFTAKMRPIIDLYLHAPDDGPVWSIDEKTSIQALQRRFPDLGLRRPAELVKREAEYIRHGTRCLTAGLDVHTGRVLGLVTPRRPAPVFVAFLDLLDAHVPPGQVIHAVVDNLNTHSGAAVAAWQAAHPDRLQLHYLPFYASWLNQIEMWFSTQERRLLRRGDFASADQMEAQILAFIATHNRLFAHPYRWTYT